ncbi:hypothetical protein CYLTODRAFT_422772 [Cylindrobasidium torrendii FP15055 ss-10]|uniref:Gelsolin-like domain-containing protein n=1 Tax=Cylindrobasidium torrendii FP15055 ss-10 TaxID=1314674 RepID=A0A0D7BCB0_9AGAR|nr:hypothetical protein CYLTODRAFT_422772 [Cylindrobasidium torrendii FP15055 ss-10]
MAAPSGSVYAQRTGGSVAPNDEGLVEWASRIKAMQDQVDADEEAEQKKLEEEIAASRLARQRRSRLGYGSRAQSLDLSAEGSKLPAIKDNAPVSAGHNSPSERLSGQDDALRKLTGGPPPTAPKSNDAISLAAFMGGKATGPRLNRHAPQQDAHDPTQFEQRSRVDAPHPIFGSKGVAMPGMVARKTAGNNQATFQTPSAAAPAPAAVTVPVDEARVRRQSTPSLAARYLEHASSPRPVSPLKISSRDRTISTPGPKPVATTGPPSRSRTPQPPRVSSPAVPAPARATTPQVHSPAPTQPRVPTASTPSLARAVQPTPRTSMGPPIPLSHSSSAAFLKAPVQKDPTPSISRLQGRGFVHQMVQQSRDLGGPSSPASAKDESGKLLGARKASVLDRWQPEGSPVKSPPPVLPKAVPIKKTKTIGPEQTATTPPPPRVVKHSPSLPSVKGRKSPSPTRTDIPSHEPSFGSATTMMIIKPTTPKPKSPRPKSPPAVRQPAVSFSAVDELGVSRMSTGSKVTFADMAPEPRKPLAHPTKERAKKPKKVKTNETVANLRITDSTRTAPAAQPSPAPLASGEMDVAALGTKSSLSAATPPQVAVTPRDIARAPSPSSGKPATATATRPNIAERWSQNITNVAEVSSSPPADTPGKMAGKQALPGMSGSNAPTLNRKKSAAGDAPGPRLPTTMQKVSPPSTEGAAPPSPIPRTRIPSTGSRATVMDVAQVFVEHARKSPEIESPTSVEEPVRIQISSPPAQLSSPVTASSVPSFARPQNDKRKSSYDRFSAVTLPPLQEEVTPTPSPAGTLSKNYVKDLVLEKEDKIHSPTLTLSFTAGPISRLDVSALIAGPPVYTPDQSIRDISVEVMLVSGSATTILSDDTNVFYDNEILAVIHRKKSISSGLVATTVWAWAGRELDAREEIKLEEIASRYRTSYILVPQYAEPAEMLKVLGGQLAVRQGSRVHWSAENTAMHVVRSRNGYILIEELDLGIQNLCAGYSYCVTVLETVYIWHGPGAVEKERKAARLYARKLGENVVELGRNASEDDEDMFWMVLGDEGYAQADYWRWRSEAKGSIDPAIWEVDASKLTHVPSWTVHVNVHSSVFIADCIWEIYVVVGKDARGKRTVIQSALKAAEELAKGVASRRPFTPVVHVLTMPSQIPLELRAHLRDIRVFGSEIEAPEHMNIVSAEVAHHQLNRQSWPKMALTDPTFLPLGVDPSVL